MRHFPGIRWNGEVTAAVVAAVLKNRITEFKMVKTSSTCSSSLDCHSSIGPLGEVLDFEYKHFAMHETHLFMHQAVRCVFLLNLNSET